MTKKQIFNKAHEITQDIKRLYKSYRDAFKVALNQVYSKIKANKPNENTHYQIKKAFELGKLAFKNNIKAPFLDKELQKMLLDREVGKTPNGEASTSEIFNAWIKANNIEQIANTYN